MRNNVSSTMLYRFAPITELKGLPPALIQVAEKVVLRGEGEAYGRKLDEAGVPVTVTRYDGMIHDYGLLNVVSTVPAVQSAMRQAELKNQPGSRQVHSRASSLSRRHGRLQGVWCTITRVQDPYHLGEPVRIT
ncbi:protein of unknown function (plasmid) [Cupriavidus taiwanensis]|uniref:Alpha/beta hydrolase fold-3 domain-containing protein n=1 Tax=Cupriavidus taiwanensis TaxID=164546 RepID=A0A375IN36_9BURK|nr:protein of unknown function [Cupriavidus taiwanensis]